MKLPEKTEIKDLDKLLSYSRRYILLSFIKHDTGKDSKGELTYTVAVSGKQCLVFKLEEAYFRYSLDVTHLD